MGWTSRKDQIRALLKSIETGDADALGVVNEAKYVQHDPHTLERSEGLAELFLRLSKTSRMGPNPSSHTMTDGPTEASHLDRTEPNRQLVRSFVEEVLIGGRLEELESYVDRGDYTEHNPDMADGFESLLPALRGAGTNTPASRYDKLHRVLADGDFVLSMCEGMIGDAGWAFYDLFRIDSGRVVEQWDTAGAIPPRSEWNNDNSKLSELSEAKSASRTHRSGRVMGSEHTDPRSVAPGRVRRFIGYERGRAGCVRSGDFDARLRNRSCRIRCGAIPRGRVVELCVLA